jgi:RNA polymerase sigma factor (sigma-70 family)
MSPDSSFEALACGLHTGDPDAAARVFRRFAQRLVQLAGRRLDRLIKVKSGPEDVVQSVFRSFFHRQRQGQLEVQGWDELWDMLVLITLRKCCNRAEHYHAACRDVRREVPPPSADGSDTAWEAVGREPSPAEAAQLAETVEQILGSFKDREQAIVELTLQGVPVTEVSARLGCSERKVYRVLERLRAELQEMQQTP